MNRQQRPINRGTPLWAWPVVLVGLTVLGPVYAIFVPEFLYWLQLHPMVVAAAVVALAILIGCALAFYLLRPLDPDRFVYRPEDTCAEADLPPELPPETDLDAEHLAVMARVETRVLELGPFGVLAAAFANP